MRPRLAQLHQSGATDGEIPVWDDATGMWVPGPGTGGGTSLGDLSDVDLTGATEGDFLQLVSGVWVPVDAPSGGSAALTYRQLMLLEQPWFYLRCEETSGTTLLGETGLVANDASITGSPTLNQTGPVDTAISWPSSASTEAYAGSAAKQSSLILTVMGWVYLTSTPSASTPIVGMAESYNNASRDKVLYVGSDGKLKWMIYTGSDSVLSSASALSLNTWHFCVGVCGPAGQKLYLDGALEASGAGQSTFTGSGQFAFVHGGGSTWTDGSAAVIAEPAVFLKQVKASVIADLYAAA